MAETVAEIHVLSSRALLFYSRALQFVIAGLDPAIHGESHFSMDHRVKPGGDEAENAGRAADVIVIGCPSRHLLHLA
jgi:hypothetical protein